MEQTNIKAKKFKIESKNIHIDVYYEKNRYVYI